MQFSKKLWKSQELCEYICFRILSQYRFVELHIVCYVAHIAPLQARSLQHVSFAVRACNTEIRETVSIV